MKAKSMVWVLFCLLALSPKGWSGVCPDTVSLHMSSRFEGQELVVTIRADRFIRISAFQFGVNYDADVFRFTDAQSSLPSFGPGVFKDNKMGNVRFVWIDSKNDGTTLPDGSGIMEMRFDVLQAYSTSFIEISPVQLPVECINFDGVPLCVETDIILASSPGTYVKGQVFFDTNSNCAYDDQETGLAEWMLEIRGSSDILYRTTDENGFYSFVAPEGQYSVRLIRKNNVWDICVQQVTISLSGDSLSGPSFAVTPLTDCPVLAVDIVTPVLERCRDNTFVIRYENQGTAEADNAYIDVSIDDDFDFVSSDIAGTTQSGSIVTIPLERVLAGEKGFINLVLALDCNATVTGQTHCVAASVFPQDLCIPAPGWSGANLSIEGECNESAGEVVFRLVNIGTGAMSSSRSYIVTEDDVMSPPQPVQLNAQEELTLSLPADGTTYRLTAGQDTGYPFASVFTTTAVEGCGETNGLFSKGYVTQFEEGDRDLFTDTECLESTVVVEPNAITGQHKGYGSDKLIQKEAHLEYTIRFQNTTTDTLKNVMIKNPIPEGLDVTTLQMGSSSHPFTFRINQKRELIITFESIQLPPAEIEEIGSRGFVRYTVFPESSVLNGTVLNSKAGIYFDYTAAAKAKEDFHTIGTNFVMTGVEWTGGEKRVSFYPNPVDEQLVIELAPNESGKVTYCITDVQGKVISGGTILNDIHSIPCDHFPPGPYHVRVDFETGQRAIFSIIKR